MLCDFLNPTIFWEYEVAKLDADEWCPFIIKQVFNRNVVALPLAIPSLIDYYGAERVEQLLREEVWLSGEGIQTARQYFPHLQNGDFRATARIDRRNRQLRRRGAYNPKL